MNQRFLMVTAALVLIVFSVIGTVAAAETDTDNTIVASGTGSVLGTPDRAQISLAVETENPNVQAAQAENAARMTKVMDALITAGIPKEALKTTGYNIYPVYDDTKIYGLQKVKTYRVTNTLTVTLHDVSRTGEVIDIGVAEGINQASSIQFFLSDEQSQVLRTEALKEATERASADARTVAGALGVSIQSVKSVQISGGYSPVRYQNYAMAESVGGGVSTPIEAGDITVTATVTVTYLIG
jgi:uncharacterized protein YggE